MSSDLRSRRGCDACRKRRRKCDETHPACKACGSRGLVCRYPEINIRLEGVRNRPRRPKAKRKSPSSHGHDTPASIVVHLDQSELNNSPSSLRICPEPMIPCVDDGPDSQSPLSLAALETPEHSAQSTDGSIVDLSFGIMHPDLDDYEDDDDSDNHEQPDVWILDDRHSGAISRALPAGNGEDIAYTFFLNYLCRIIQASEAWGNAYRRLAVMAVKIPALRDTIISCATEYMHCQGRISTYVNITRRQKALQSLQQALVQISDTADLPGEGGLVPRHGQHGAEDSVSHADTLLAAILLQVASVSFAGEKAHLHVTAAYQLFERLGYSQHPVTDFVPTLLVHRFAMIEVASSILQNRRPRLQPSFWLFKIQDACEEADFSLQQLTGCPQRVLAFLAQASHLTADVADNRDVVSSATWDRAEGLECDMRNYAEHLRNRCPGAFDQGTENDVAHGQDDPDEGTLLLKVNWCWLLMAMLVLQRRVFKDRTDSGRVQQTVAKMIHLIKTIPPTCGVGSSLPLPFFLMSREVIRPEDQAWVRQYHKESLSTYANPVRRTMFTLTEQIWARRQQKAAAHNPAMRFDEEIEKLEKEQHPIIF
ncbi:hypothetical protein PV04_09106 [Phialophora macrospora]|uniref:Zn(2)-C6 fungal-type domain-containing protein n=1 Tax=Phialophora macrospora TaxID=1851006 RepID=A0A0D2DPJ3_9EURO|nr:hypothetical protein PV04_09106 [Phialophora macrospora]